MIKQTDQLAAPPIRMPSVEQIQQELSSAQSIDDFFGKEGILTPPTIWQTMC